MEGQEICMEYQQTFMNERTRRSMECEEVIVEYKEIHMEYQETFWNTNSFYGRPNGISRNELWSTKERHGIPISFIE